MEQTVWEKMVTGHLGSATGRHAHGSSYFLKQGGVEGGEGEQGGIIDLKLCIHPDVPCS